MIDYPADTPRSTRGRPLAEIVDLYGARRKARGPVIARMEAMRRQYNGDIAIPLPQLDRNEESAVANLYQTGVDQTAMRIASTIANLWFPPNHPGKRDSERNSRIARKAVIGWWEHNDLDMADGIVARWFVAYGTSATIIRPDFARRMPRWQARNPLTTYPAPTVNPWDYRPPDCIFTYRRTWGDLVRCYGATHFAALKKPDRIGDDDQFTCVEYVDHDVIVLAVLGWGVEDGAVDTANSSLWTPTGGKLAGDKAVELERIDNRAECCPAITPGRLTLDRSLGQFDGIVGMYQQQAKLMALQLIAVQKGIMPEKWLVANGPNQPKIITPADPRTGQMGVVKDGAITEVRVDPSFANLQAIDRLERGQRMQGGIPAEMTGESQSNVRTGRRGDSILANTIDYTVQEAHKVLARARRAETQVAIEIDKAYFGDEPKSFYVSWKNAKGPVDYIPNKHLTSANPVVSFPQAGADQQQLVIGGGQRVAQGSLSLQSFMEIDPMVDDAELEHDRVIKERLERSILDEFSQPGSMPVADKARVMELVVTDQKELADAVLQVQREAQERQSSTVDPAEPGSPEAQPGLAPPGMGAEAGVAVPEPQPSQANLAQMLSALRRPQMSLAGEGG